MNHFSLFTGIGGIDINAKRGYPWENNDWVFVYEFMRANGL
jgi:hypothetical protein